MEFDHVSQGLESSDNQECLIFILNGQEYGIDILCVQEIRGYDSRHITTIANMPDFFKGIINLRGVIVPIIDLRIKFDLTKVDYTDQTVVVILNIHSRVTGVVVDGVSDVINLQPDQIKDAPQFHSTVSAQYLTGIGTLAERMIILMDIKRLLSSEDMALTEQTVI